MAREAHLGHKELHAIVDIVCEHRLRVLRQLVSFTLQKRRRAIRLLRCEDQNVILLNRVLRFDRDTLRMRATTDFRLLFRTMPLRSFFYNDRYLHHYWRTRILVKILNQTWCCLRIKIHDDLGINRAHLILM